MKPGNSGYGPGARKYRVKTGVYLLKREGWQPCITPFNTQIFYPHKKLHGNKVTVGNKPLRLKETFKFDTMVKVKVKVSFTNHYRSFGVI